MHSSKTSGTQVLLDCFRGRAIGLTKHKEDNLVKTFREVKTWAHSFTPGFSAGFPCQPTLVFQVANVTRNSSTDHDRGGKKLVL